MMPTRSPGFRPRSRSSPATRALASSSTWYVMIASSTRTATRPAQARTVSVRFLARFVTLPLSARKPRQSTVPGLKPAPRRWYGGTTVVPVARTHVEPGPGEVGPTRRSIAFVALEPDEPVETVTINDLPIGSTPRPHLQVVYHPAVFGETREPATQSRGSGSTKQGQHHAFGPEWQLVSRHIGARHRNVSVGQVAVGNGIGRAVGPVELRESVQLNCTAKDFT